MYLSKNKSKTLEKQKGITLIALVVTIVVLLILAGVSISMLSGDDGIITNAQDAHKENDVASVKEQAQLDIMDYVAKEKVEGNSGIVNTPEKVKEILNEANPDETNRYFAGYTETGVKTAEGNIVPFEELYNAKPTEETESKTVEDLQVGDIVNYIDKNGITRECVVLYDASYGYGVQIITKDITEQVTLGNSDAELAKEAYNNAIPTLNQIAVDNYLNTTYATDARCVGSVPNDKDLKSEEIYKSGLITPDEHGQIDYDQMNVANARNDEEYWLASNCIFKVSNGELFVVRTVYGGTTYNEISFIGVVSTDGSIIGQPRTSGFRPVFTLRPNMKIEEDGGKYNLIAENT